MRLFGICKRIDHATLYTARGYSVFGTPKSVMEHATSFTMI